MGQLRQPLSTAQLASAQSITYGEKRLFGYSQPAHLASLSSTSVHANVERRYLTSISMVCLGGQYRIDEQSGVAILLSHYGLATYRDQSLRLSYGRKLAPKTSIGIVMDYNHVSIANYGSRSQLSPSVGLSTALFPSTSISILGIYNANHLKQHVAALGIKHQLSSNVSMVGELVYTENRISPNAHIHFVVMPQFSLTIGLADSMSLPSFGIAWASSHGLALSFAASTHDILGSSLSLSASFHMQ